MINYTVIFKACEKYWILEQVLQWLLYIILLDLKNYKEPSYFLDIAFKRCCWLVPPISPFYYQ